MDTYTQFKTFLENLAGYVETYRSVTSSSTLAADDYRKTLLVDSGSAVTLTIPTHASVPFEIGAVIPITHIGTGTVTIAAASGVTLRQRSGSVESAGQWAEMAVRKIAANEWILCGDLADGEGEPGDETAPELVSATVEEDGETLTLVFDENVNVGTGGNGGFALTASGGAATLTYASGDGTTTLVYDISRVVEDDETLTLDYTQPGDGIEDDAGNDLANIEDEAVTNDSEEAGGSGPGDTQAFSLGGEYNYQLAAVADTKFLAVEFTISGGAINDIHKIASRLKRMGTAATGDIRMLIRASGGSTPTGGNLVATDWIDRLTVGTSDYAWVNFGANDIEFDLPNGDYFAILESTVSDPDSSNAIHWAYGEEGGGGLSAGDATMCISDDGTTWVGGGAGDLGVRLFTN